MKNKVALWAVFSILIGSPIGLAQKKPSLAGNWKLDITQSEFGSDPAPKSMICTVLKDTPQMFSYRAHGLDDKGKSFAFSWSGPLDGSGHPILQDGKRVAQQSVTREQDGTLIRHGEDLTDGSSFEVRASISPDGNTLTEEVTSKSKDGKESRQKNVWHRIGGSQQHASGKTAS
jgi:hypothetical protein